jgi:hypothetical protein
MIKFVRLDAVRFLVHCNDYDLYFMGNLKDAIIALEALEIPRDEIDFALCLFDEKSHNVADFGVCRILTYTAYEGLTSKAA